MFYRKAKGIFKTLSNYTKFFCRPPVFYTTKTLAFYAHDSNIGIFFISSYKVIALNKRYFIIDQQIARHFVHFSEYIYHPLLCNSNN